MLSLFYSSIVGSSSFVCVGFWFLVFVCTLIRAQHCRKNPSQFTAYNDLMKSNWLQEITGGVSNKFLFRFYLCECCANFVITGKQIVKKENFSIKMPTK